MTYNVSLLEIAVILLLALAIGGLLAHGIKNLMRQQHLSLLELAAYFDKEAEGRFLQIASPGTELDQRLSAIDREVAGSASASDRLRSDLLDLDHLIKAEFGDIQRALAQKLVSIENKLAGVQGDLSEIRATVEQLESNERVRRFQDV